MKKTRWMIFLIVLLTGSTILYFLLPKWAGEKQTQYSQLGVSEAFFAPVEIISFHSQIPHIAIDVGNTTAQVKIDLGFDGTMILPKEVIKRIDEKSFVKRSSFFSARGKQYEADLYAIPELKIGRLTFFKPQVRELNPEFESDAILVSQEDEPVNKFGTIGWPLFQKTNFFLDCQNSLLAFCDSLNTLKEKGYPVDFFIETPLLLDRGLIEFEAMTDSGPMRCMLDTGCTWNMLNRDMEGGANDHMIFNQISLGEHAVLNPQNSDLMLFDPDEGYDISMFKIGTKDFGETSFMKFKTPLKIDAIIGMEFLESKLVFIDFSHRKIYFYEPLPSELPISLQKNP